MDRDAKLIFENYKKSILNELAPTAALPTLAGPTLAGTAATKGLGAASLMTGPLGWLILATSIIGSVALKKYLDSRELKSIVNNNKEITQKVNLATEILKKELYTWDYTRYTPEQSVEAYKSILTKIGSIDEVFSNLLKPLIVSLKIDKYTKELDEESAIQGSLASLNYLNGLVNYLKNNKEAITKNNPSLTEFSLNALFSSIEEEIKIVRTAIEEIHINPSSTSISNLPPPRRPGERPYTGGGAPPRRPPTRRGYGEYDPFEDPEFRRKKQERQLSKMDIENYNSIQIGRLSRQQANRMSPLWWIGWIGGSLVTLGGLILYLLKLVLGTKRVGLGGLVPTEDGLLDQGVDAAKRAIDYTEQPPPSPTPSPGRPTPSPGQTYNF